MRDFFLIIAGYASIFNKLDKSDDMILPGTFNNLITPIKLLYGHNKQLALGELLFAQEDNYGLYIEAVLFCHEAWQRSLVRRIIKKDISGLSIGLLVEENKRLEGVNLISQGQLCEVSITSQPINKDCQIDFAEFFVVGDSGLEPPTSTMSR